MAQKRPLKSVAIQQADRRQQVAELARAGMTTRQIADQIGCGTTTVHRDRHMLLGEIYDVATADMVEWRRVKLEGYARKMEQLDTAIDEVDPEAREKIAPLVSAWVKVDERESRLIGADAPVRSQVEQTVTPMSEARALEIIAEMSE